MIAAADVWAVGGMIWVASIVIAAIVFTLLLADGADSPAHDWEYAFAWRRLAMHGAERVGPIHRTATDAGHWRRRHGRHELTLIRVYGDGHTGPPSPDELAQATIAMSG